MRSARGESLSRNPLAPARSASYTYSSRSKVVSMTTLGAGCARVSSRVASSPSIPGMRMSISTTLLRREFAHVRHVATFWNGAGVSDDEQGAPIFVATGLRSSWAQVWPAFRNYS